MMPIKKFITALFLLFVCLNAQSQTWFRDYTDLYDTVWDNSPTAGTYSPGHGAVISTSVGGSPGWGFYHYNYLIHLDNNGDTVWTKRYILDSTFTITVAGGFIDTIHYEGIVQSVVRLNGNGNYLVGGYNFSPDNGYLIKQFDSAGNMLSSHLIFDTSLSTEQRSPYIKLIAAEGNKFYLLYMSDSIFYVPGPGGGPGYDSDVTITRIGKLDNNYTLYWAHDYRYSFNMSYPGGRGSSAIDVANSILTADSGIAFTETFDTCVYPGGNYYLVKLKPNGSFDWRCNLHSVLDTTAVFSTCFATHDSCIVAGAYSIGSSGMSFTGHLLKFGATGSLLDSMHFLNDTAIGYNGVELSTGKYLFLSGYQSEFFIYDRHLNYLTSMPYPFPEAFTNGSGVPFIANPYGGAFWAYQGGNPGIMPSWHMVGVNFDSTFQCYPAYVTGKVYQDNNYDCIDNTGDLDIKWSVVTLHDAISGRNYYGFGGDTGYYVGNVPYGNYTVSHHPSGYEVNECGAYTHVISAPSTYINNDFADTLVPGIMDLQLWLYSYCLVPGSTTGVIACAFNNGTVTVDTTIVFVLDHHTYFVSSTPTPINVSGDTVTYRVHLLSDSLQYFMMTIGVTTSALLGDTVVFTATSPFPDNVVPTDDSAVYSRVVVSSFDPNFISVNQPLYFHRNNSMIYTVGFENTGTHAAKNIVVVDTLDSRLDPATFHFLDAGPVTPKISWLDGNRLYFKFENINLPDSITDPSGSHGQFSYSIKVKSTVPDGDTIFNKAYIYFDYNLPVITNTTVNILSAASGFIPLAANKQFNTHDRDVQIFPNPTSGIVNILFPTANEDWNITVSDLYGHVMRAGQYHAQSVKINIDASAGVYFVTVTDQKTHERFTQKLIINKE